MPLCSYALYFPRWNSLTVQVLVFCVRASRLWGRTDGSVCLTVNEGVYWLVHSGMTFVSSIRTSLYGDVVIRQVCQRL